MTILFNNNSRTQAFCKINTQKTVVHASGIALDRKSALCHKNEIPYEYKTRMNHMHAFIEIQTKFIQQTNSKIPLRLFFFPPAAVFAHIQARPIESFYSLFYIYESCFLLRNNNFFTVHTPAYRTRKDIKLRVIPFIGITSMNEFPRKTLDKQYVYILY